LPFWHSDHYGPSGFPGCFGLPGHSGFPRRSGFPVVLAFRSFWLSGRSDFSVVIALKNLFKKEKPVAQ
jgi:hypothetical protein